MLHNHFHQIKELQIIDSKITAEMAREKNLPVHTDYTYALHVEPQEPSSEVFQHKHQEEVSLNEQYNMYARKT